MSLSSYSENGLRIQGHRFEPKRFFKPKKCSSCNKYVAIGTKALICRFCGIIIHTKCQDASLRPCSQKPKFVAFPALPGTIEAYAPSGPPFVPSLVVRCIREVELRGREKEELYLTEAYDNEALSLLDNLLTNEKATDLRKVDIYVIASTLKLFLSLLSEPLLTRKLRDDFVRLIESFQRNNEQVLQVDKLLWQLPEANLDTLAFLIIHLQKISDCLGCEMSRIELAMKFGPAIVGEDIAAIDRTTVVEFLLNMPLNVWTRRIDFEQLLMPRTHPVIISETTHSRWSLAYGNPEELNYEENAIDELEKFFF